MLLPPRPQQTSSSPFGLLTKTLLRSNAVTAWFPLRLAGVDQSCLVAVAAHLVCVLKLTDHGRLKTCSVKADFDCAILSAAVLPAPDHALSGIKSEHAQSVITASDQLVIVLDNFTSLILSFSYANGNSSISHDAIPLPAAHDLLCTIGTHIAAAPDGRYIAYGAYEGCIFIVDSRNNDRTHIQIPGVLHDLTFLYTPQSCATFHLVAAVILDGRVVFCCATWQSDTPFIQVKSVESTPIDVDPRTLGPLIPLQTSSSLLLITSTVAHLFAGLPTGDASHATVSLGSSPIEASRPSSPGSLWSAWCHVDFDRIHCVVFVSADGRLCQLHHSDDMATPSITYVDTTDTSCKNVTAVACMTDAHAVRTLAISHSHGGYTLYSIDIDRNGVLQFSPLRTQTSWSAVTDLAVVDSQTWTRLPAVMPNVWLSSAALPNGHVSPLRLGLRSLALPLVSMEALHACIDLHIFSSALPSQQIVLFTCVAVDGSRDTIALLDDGDEMTQVAQDTLPMPLDLQNLTIASASNHHSICQVTEGTISKISLITSTLEYHLDVSAQSKTVICAAIYSNLGYAAVATRTSDPDAMVDTFEVSLIHLDKHGVEPTLQSALSISGTPAALCVVEESPNRSAYTVMSISDHRLCFVRNDRHGRQQIVLEHGLHDPQSMPIGCDSLVLTNAAVVDQSHTYTLACGCRDGAVLLLDLEIASGNASKASSDQLEKDIRIVRQRHVLLGTTSVRLFRQPSETTNASSSFIAVTDSATFLIEPAWTRNCKKEKVTQVWFESEITGAPPIGAIAALAHIPSSDSNSSFMIVSQGICMFARLDAQPSDVPQGFDIEGTPLRMIYSTRLSYFVIATQVTEALPESDQTADINHITRGRLEFRSLRKQSSKPCFYPLQAGERVTSLLEWTYTKEASKSYVFLLVGTTISAVDGYISGRIHVVQPIMKHGRIEDVTLAMTHKHADPVSCMVLCDDVCFAACIGLDLTLYAYMPDQKKWVTAHKSTMPSRAVHMSCHNDAVMVTTAEHSMLVYRYDHLARTLTRICSDDAAYQGLYHARLAVARLETDESTDEAMEIASVSNETSPDAHMEDIADETNLLLMSTRQRQLRVFKYPSSANSPKLPGQDVLECEVHADLGRSLIRLYNTDVVVIPEQSVIQTHGISPDGTLYGLSCLTAENWAVLKFVQTLCQRSLEICPHLQNASHDLYKSRTSDNLQDHTPIGLAGLKRYQDESDLEYDARIGRVTDTESGSSQLLWQPENMHVNADILQRLLRKGEEMLCRMLERESEQCADRIGRHVAKYLVQEKEIVAGAMELVRRAVTHWGRNDTCLHE